MDKDDYITWWRGRYNNLVSDLLRAADGEDVSFSDSDDFPHSDGAKMLLQKVKSGSTERSDLEWLADTLSDIYLGGESGWRECGVKKLFEVIRDSGSRPHAPDIDADEVDHYIDGKRRGREIRSTPSGIQKSQPGQCPPELGEVLSDALAGSCQGRQCSFNVSKGDERGVLCDRVATFEITTFGVAGWQPLCTEHLNVCTDMDAVWNQRRISVTPDGRESS